MVVLMEYICIRAKKAAITEKNNEMKNLKEKKITCKKILKNYESIIYEDDLVKYKVVSSYGRSIVKVSPILLHFIVQYCLIFTPDFL